MIWLVEVGFAEYPIRLARRCDVSGHRNGPDPRKWVRADSFLGLVVLVRVDGELAKDFAGDGVDDADVEVGDEQDDVGSGVGSSDADVAEFAFDAEGDGAVVVDDVVADSVVAVGVAAASRDGFRDRVVERCGGCSVRE